MAIRSRRQTTPGSRRAPPGERMPLAPPRVDEDDSTPPPARPPMSDDTKPPVLRKIPVPRSRQGRADVLGPELRPRRSRRVHRLPVTGHAHRRAHRDARPARAGVRSCTRWRRSSTSSTGRASPGSDWSSRSRRCSSRSSSTAAGEPGGCSCSSWCCTPVWCSWRRRSSRSAIGAVVVELLILAGLALAVVGWVLCIVPPANRWFRLKDEAQSAALD